MNRSVCKENLVVISYYDQRPIDTLFALLDQIRSVDPGAPFDVCVVVNAEKSTPTRLPDRHHGIEVLHRENRGFNVGAWQHGWQAKPDYAFYLFLQDECVIRRPGWLAAFANAARKPRAGYAGESADCYGSWETYTRCWPAFTAECQKVAAIHGIPLGPKPDYIQTVVVGARREVLKDTGGFVEGHGHDKISAIAGEVLTSVRARALGFRNLQVAWRPFEYIEHPQWAEIRTLSGTWRWRVSRAMHLYLPSAINRLVPRRRGGNWPNAIPRT